MKKIDDMKEIENMKERNNIILIGFMGSGKTSVGKYLADKLNYTFKDTDKMIEEESGCSISHIFSTKGEEYFRTMETKTIQNQIGKLEHTILSTGGGLPITEGNGELLRQIGTVVFLKTTKDTIKNRLSGDNTRPLLAGEDADYKIETLLNYRTPIYEAAAHMIVNTDNKSLDMISEEIVNKCK